MGEKALEILFKTARSSLEAIQNAGSHEEVDTYSNMLGDVLDGIHEIVKSVIQ